MGIKRRYPLDRQGMILVTTIMLIVVVSIVVLGMTTFIVQRLSQTELKSQKEKAFDLANAGVQFAIYHIRTDKNYSAVNEPFGLTVDSTVNCNVPDSDLLMVDTISSSVKNSGAPCGP